MKKEDIALTVGGILASIAVSYLIYRLEQNNAATNAANAAAQAQAEETAQASAAYQQQSLLASVGSSAASVGSSTTTTYDPTASSSTDVTASTSNGAGLDQNLESIISAFMTPQQPVSNPGAPVIAPLPVTTEPIINNGGVNIPTLNQPVSVTTTSTGTGTGSLIIQVPQTNPFTPVGTAIQSTGTNQ
jgi:hypothetical protein